ncbi:MAG: 5'-3' exonuclease H3TH domain-containing protein, partial [Pseudonocardiaceae bacterium]
ASRYGLPETGAGPAYADLAALRGDPSDGLPGVPGIGEKTAATLINRFGSVEGLLAALDDPQSAITAGLRVKLRAARDYLVAAHTVVRVATGAPVRQDRDDTLPSTPADPGALASLQREWGLGTAVDRLVAALQARG